MQPVPSGRTSPSWCVRQLLAGVAVATLAACTTVGPDYAAPDTELPDQWQQELTQGLSEGKADLRTWWTVLDEPKLDELIDRATEGNLDLKTAVARIEAARARYGVASGDLYPTVDNVGAIDANRVGKKVSTGVAPPRDRTDTLYSYGIDSSWELDVWGGIRRGIESADASLSISIEDYRDTLVILYADVAQAYVAVRTFQTRIVSALKNVETQRGALRLTQDRNRAGLAPDLDVRQAELNLATTEAFVPELRSLLLQTINRLAVLLGEYPGALQAELAPDQAIPKPPEAVLVDLPTDLLRQRPDIRSSERALAAQTANIGVATADLYPRFTLSGAFAFQAYSTGDVFTSNGLNYSIGPSLAWNLFDGGRVRNNIAVQDALAREALANYENTVLSAVEEVESGIVAYVQEIERLEYLRRSVVAANQSVALVETLYRSGLTDFQNVLDTQRSQFIQEDSYTASQGLVVRNLIAIYKAFGGGWAPLTEDPEKQDKVG